MLNEKFWLALSFTAFIALAFKFLWPKISKILSDKSRAIAEEILAAKEMKEKATQLLAKAEKYQKESEQFSQKLIEDAAIEAQKFAAEAAKMLEKEIAKKTAAALERIKSEEAAAIREIKAKIIASSMENLSQNIGTKMNKNHHQHLLNKASDDLAKIIN